nr:MAG TPA: hypothetical protein [Caudoviricetes sp.]
MIFPVLTSKQNFSKVPFSRAYPRKVNKSTDNPGGAFRLKGVP